MFDHYTMNREVQKKVWEYTKESGLPEPRDPIQPLVTALITCHKLSLICGEIDEIVDRICLIHDYIDEAIEDGNLTSVVMLKDRLEVEKKKLKAYERLLEREGPLSKKEYGITDEMIQRARDYPFEDLLPGELKRGRCACPIHGGDNAMSFMVKDNYGKCFSCGWPNGKPGDTIQYVMDTQGLTFMEAVRKLS